MAKIVRGVIESDGTLVPFGLSNSGNVTVTEITQSALDLLDDAGIAALGLYIIVAEIPSGYSVNINQANIDAANDDALSFTFAGATVGVTYAYSITSSGGGTAVTGTGIIATATDTISSIDVSGLTDGTLTLSVTLTNSTGIGTAVTDTVVKDTAVVGLLPSPSSSNPNPELVTGNAFAFGVDESTSTSNQMQGAVAATVSAELVDDGYVGDYVYQIVSTSEIFDRQRFNPGAIPATVGQVYRVYLLYRMTVGSNGGIAIFSGATPKLEVQNLAATNWTLLTWDITITSGGTDIRPEIYATDAAGGGASGDTIQAKLSIKLLS